MVRIASVCALLWCLSCASSVAAGEVGGAPEPGPRGGSAGVIAGLPQLVAFQWEIPAAQDLDVALHAGALVWIGSVGARLRWRHAEPGWHPYLFGGVALVSVLVRSDSDHDSYLGLWPGAGLEWRGSRWKWQCETGAALGGDGGSHLCFAVGVARLN
jgi:hypothetical protein